MKRRWLALGAAAVLSMTLAFQPMTAHALEKNGEIWDDLSGSSTVNSKVVDQEGHRYWTTIQTNYHAGSSTGLVVQTPMQEVRNLLGITDDDAACGQTPVLFVSNSSNGQNFWNCANEKAASIGGKMVYEYWIQLYKWTGTWNEPRETTSAPIRMVIGIEDKDIEAGYTFTVLHMVGDQGTFINDLDDDPKTLTFETSEFNGTYLVIKHPVENKTAGSAAAGSAAADSADELDEVPKMDDGRTVMPAVIFTGSILLGAAAFLYRRKITV